VASTAPHPTTGTCAALPTLDDHLVIALFLGGQAGQNGQGGPGSSSSSR
jgi:hypothetical protein